MSTQPIVLRTDRIPGETIESQDVNEIAGAVNDLASNSGGGGGGVTDHGALDGLGDDDHPQYALADGSRGEFVLSVNSNPPSPGDPPGNVEITHNDIGAQPVATGAPDGTKFLRDDNSWQPVPSGGGDPALLDHQIYSQHGSLPGRAITATAADVPLGANIAIGSIFRLPIPAKINTVTCSVKVAATAGATGRVAIYSWEWDGTCTLVQDQGTVSIDTVAQQVSSNFTGFFLPAGEYVAVFIPEAAVTMRMLYIYDVLLGFQGGQEFNAGANRAYAYPQATLGSYPGSAPAVLTMIPSTSNGGIASTSRSWCTVRTEPNT